MKRIYFLALLLALVAIGSCRKGSKSPAPEEIMKNVMEGAPLDSDIIYNYVLLNNSQSENSLTGGAPNDISVMATFQDGSSRRVSAGDLGINSRAVSINTNSMYEFKYTGSDTLEGKGLVGQNIALSLSGSRDYSARTRNVYVPANIMTAQLYTFSATIHQSADYPLKWSPDPNTLDGNMYIQVSYYGLYSRLDNPKLPKAIDPLVYVVPDNGRFTIPASDLQRFPLGGYITIAMARGVQYIDNTTMTRTRVYYFTITDFQTRLLQMIP